MSVSYRIYPDNTIEHEDDWGDLPEDYCDDYSTYTIPDQLVEHIESQVTLTTDTKDNPDELLMPRALTAKNGAKSRMIGEFYEKQEVDCPECSGEGCSECLGAGHYDIEVTISWTNIKSIYSLAVSYFDNKGTK